MKKRDFTATNTYQSPSAIKIFFDSMKDRKRNSEWGVKSAEIKEKFLLTLKHREILIACI